MKLTGLEQRIVDYLSACNREGKAVPSLREMGRAVGVNSPGTMGRYVNGLVDKGVLKKTPKRWRSLEVVSQSEGLPLLGKIAAGKPLEAMPVSQSIDLNVYLGGANRFAIQVEGDSMIEAGILDGDLVIIQQKETAKTSDIVVAFIDNQEATLKRFKKRAGNKVELIPANRKMKSMIYDAERVSIQGVLVGQLRKYT